MFWRSRARDNVVEMQNVLNVLHDQTDKQFTTRPITETPAPRPSIYFSSVPASSNPDRPTCFARTMNRSGAEPTQ